MKELAVLLLIGMVLAASGCVQQAPQNQPPPAPGTDNNPATPPAPGNDNAGAAPPFTAGADKNEPAPILPPPVPGTDGNLSAGNAALNDDVESMAEELASVDSATPDENGLAPLTADDLDVE